MPEWTPALRSKDRLLRSDGGWDHLGVQYEEQVTARHTIGRQGERRSMREIGSGVKAVRDCRGI